MSRTFCKVPDDFWGLSIEQVRRAIKGKARLTNMSYRYDGARAKFNITDVGPWRIVADSKKKLDRATTRIADLRREKGLSGSAIFKTIRAC